MTWHKTLANIFFCHCSHITESYCFFFWWRLSSSFNGFPHYLWLSLLLLWLLFVFIHLLTKQLHLSLTILFLLCYSLFLIYSILCIRCMWTHYEQYFHICIEFYCANYNVNGLENASTCDLNAEIFIQRHREKKKSKTHENKKKQEENDNKGKKNKKQKMNTNTEENKNICFASLRDTFKYCFKFTFVFLFSFICYKKFKIRMRKFSRNNFKKLWINLE